jgi:ATP dependent DNA ligase-like protein
VSALVRLGYLRLAAGRQAEFKRRSSSPRAQHEQPFGSSATSGSLVASTAAGGVAEGAPGRGGGSTRNPRDATRLRDQPLRKRKRRLEQLIPANNPTLSRLLAVEEHGRELFEAAQRLDLEGIVAKRQADPYSPQTVWYKVKNPAYTQAEGRGDLFHKPR